MNELRISATGFPETTKTWNFTQDILKDVSKALSRFAGENIIISGVEIDAQAGTVSEGYIIYNDEILQFNAGLTNTTVSIIEEVEEVPYNTDANNDTVLDTLPAYVTRYAVCGSGLPNTIATIPFASLNRIKTLFELSAIEKATQVEANTDNEDTKFITANKLANRTATTNRKGVVALSTSVEVSEGIDATKSVTPKSLKDADIKPFKVSKGILFTQNANVFSQSQFDFSKNYAYVYPPTGYTMSDLIGFIPSINIVYFGGDVSYDDTLWCNYSVSSTRITVICNNSENRNNSKINYLAIWQK